MIGFLLDKDAYICIGYNIMLTFVFLFWYLQI